MPVFLEGYGESEGIYKIAAGLRGYLGGGRKKGPSSGSEEEGQEVIGPRSVVVVSDPVIVKRILTSSPVGGATSGCNVGDGA
ncbi:unnamed protein product, partial [Durusdinium trenchii]